MSNNESKIVHFLADSVLKFSAGIDIFIKFLKNDLTTVCPAQCCLKNAILMQKFWSWHLMERFSGWYITL